MEKTEDQKEFSSYIQLANDMKCTFGDLLIQFAKMLYEMENFLMDLYHYPLEDTLFSMKLAERIEAFRVKVRALNREFTRYEKAFLTSGVNTIVSYGVSKEVSYMEAVLNAIINDMETGIICECGKSVEEFRETILDYSMKLFEIKVI